MSKGYKKGQVLLTTFSSGMLLSLLLTGALSGTTGTVDVVDSGMIRGASATSEDGGGEDNQAGNSGEVTDQGESQDDSGDQNRDQGNVNTQSEGESMITDSPEQTPSPPSQNFLGRGSPQVPDNTLNGGGSNIIARDCPDKGPIPPDCTLNPFPPTPPKCPDKGPIPPDCTLNPFPLVSGGESQGEVTPTPTPTPSPTIVAPPPTLIESAPPTITNFCSKTPRPPFCPPTPNPTIAPNPTLVAPNDVPTASEKGLFSADPTE